MTANDAILAENAILAESKPAEEEQVNNMGAAEANPAAETQNQEP